MRVKIMTPLALALVLSTPALAQECGTLDEALPDALAGWTEDAADGPALTLGAPADIALTVDAKFAVAPERPPDPGSHGGNAVIDIDQAGTYLIALGARSWIDVVDASGRRIASTAHGHGPACSSIAKMVSFPLVAGRYVIQLSNTGDDHARLMVARAPN